MVYYRLGLNMGSLSGDLMIMVMVMMMMVVVVAVMMMMMMMWQVLWG